MVWLSPILSSEHNGIALLPIPCLCDLLTSAADPTAHHTASEGEQRQRVLKRLQAYARGSVASESQAVLTKLMASLGSPSAAQRSLTRGVLQQVLEPLEVRPHTAPGQPP